MSTIIDSLVITLGLDPQGFSKGQKEIEQGLKRTRNDADSSAKAMESSGKRAGAAFNNLRNEVVGLALAVSGARTLGDFASNILRNDAAVGRLSKNIGLATEKIGAWQAAVREMGGSNEDANSALGILGKSLSDIKLGLRPDNAAVLNALGLNQDNMRNPSDMLLAIADASKRMDPTVFANLTGRLGFSPPMIALLERGGDTLRRQLPTWERMAGIYQANADASARFNSTLADIQTTLEGRAQPAVAKFADVLGQLAASKDGMQIAGDVIVGTLAAIGVAAASAYLPVVALAGAIALALKAKQDWEKGDPWVSIKHLSPDQVKARDAKRAADPKDPYGKGLWGGLQAMWNSDWVSIRHSSPAASAPTAAGRSGTTRLSALAGRLVARGIDPGTAQGIAAGIMAEGGSTNADNPVSHAFGIGQWLGPRKAALFAKYGPHPTATQQLDFLVSELRGGDRGGASVLSSTDPRTAGLAYIWNFMRPQGAHYEHMRDAIADTRRMQSYLGRGSAPAVTVGDINVTVQNDDGRKAGERIAGNIKRRLQGLHLNGPFN